MATVRENKKNGKTVSYRFTVCLERDAQGKQVRRYMTWTPEEGLTPSKAKKAAERAADAWEQEVRAEYQKEKELGRAYRLPPDKRHDDFVSFVNDTWLALQIRGGNAKPSTVAFYEYMSKIIVDYFKGAVLQEITLGGGIVHIGYLPHMDAAIKLERSDLSDEIICGCQKWFDCGFIHLRDHILFQPC